MRIRENRRLRLIILTAAFVLIGITILARLKESTVTETAYESIQFGSSRQEASQILGESQGHSREEFTYWLNNRSPRTGQGSDLLNGENRDKVEYWFQDSGVIIIDFDDNGQVVDKQFLHIDVATFRQGIQRTLQRLGF
jgi:hypothetical protein